MDCFERLPLFECKRYYCCTRSMLVNAKLLIAAKQKEKPLLWRSPQNHPFQPYPSEKLLNKETTRFTHALPSLSSSYFEYQVVSSTPTVSPSLLVAPFHVRWRS